VKLGYELKNIASEDIEDLLLRVETAFNFTFADKELVHITSFGQLCDHITNKIQLENSEDCTSQQAFYKLREAISKMFNLDKNTISTGFFLAEILPRKLRRSRTKELEKQIGFKLNILRPPHWVTGTLVVLLLASIVGIFFNWPIGLSVLIFSIAGLWFANKIGNELDLKTVGQVAEKMTRENYLNVRRNQNTFNKKEIEKVLTDWFSSEFDLDKSKLTREAKFI
jgi:hypothetical protein